MHMLRVSLLVAALLTPSLLSAASTHTGVHQNHAAHRAHSVASSAAGPTATEPGQAAFAAIAEVVALLQADAKTNWAKVDIDALREHLVDMHRVFTQAKVRTARGVDGITFVVTGTGDTRASIVRMTTAHARTMDGTGGESWSVQDHPEGVVVTVTTGTGALDRLHALGFFGLLAQGMHHTRHHVQIALGNGHGH